MGQRKSGILLHITSLPSDYGIGDLGPGAYAFVDFLHRAKQHFWQVLPLNLTDPVCGNSPYSSLSAFAVNTLLISPQLLLEDGLLTRDDLRFLSPASGAHVDYEKVADFKEKILKKAYTRFAGKATLQKEFQKFLGDNAAWVDDFAFFVAIKESLGRIVWTKWPDELKRRDAAALVWIQKRFHDRLAEMRFLQFLFVRQWNALKSYAHEKGVRIIGDIPIYVDFDSVDVWKNPQDFKLETDGSPVVVAGVPPDYFSATGQRWGNPVYNWDVLQKERYAWWVARLKHSLQLFDVVRIDHFRGLVQYWAIPAAEKVATNGSWQPVPTQDFFAALRHDLGELPIIAEDLGIITDDVREVMAAQGFPGMKVLLFAFGEDLVKHPYLPHNYDPHCVVYTGTHDNNTVQGWFRDEATPHEKENFVRYFGRPLDGQDIHWAFIELAMKSKAETVITPMQDVLGLGGDARMNKPGTTHGNWRWRLAPEALEDFLALRLARLTEETGRA